MLPTDNIAQILPFYLISQSVLPKRKSPYTDRMNPSDMPAGHQVGWGAWIRTTVSRIKTCCPTTRRHLNKMAPGDGIEPPLTVLETAVIPIDQPGKSDSRPHTRELSWWCLSIILPQEYKNRCALRDSNPHSEVIPPLPHFSVLCFHCRLMWPSVLSVV